MGQTKTKSRVNSKAKAISEQFQLPLWMRHYVIPLFLMSACPLGVFLLWDMCDQFKGNFGLWLAHVQTVGVTVYLGALFGPLLMPSLNAWLEFFGFVLFQVMLYHILPGKSYLGPQTAKGYQPAYRDNGLLAFGVTVGVFALGIFSGWISKSHLYDMFPQYLMASNEFALAFCVFLYLKGRYKPSSPDSGSNGSIVFDYYWGMELYPEVFKTPLKLITNCRIGMMIWPILGLACLLKQVEIYGWHDSMLVSVLLQFIYVTKFFIWEKGYLHTTDIIHDRAGFYICWGCLVFVPGFYTSPSFFLVHNPIDLGLPTAALIFVMGLVGIWTNYWADIQKIAARSNPKDAVIWGKAPRIIRASYTNEVGKKGESVLLASGFWGLSRHFHYLPELLAAFCWSAPALTVSLIPYSYFIFLSILLFHRVERDENRCSKKYGAFWQDYKNLVPSKIIPAIY